MDNARALSGRPSAGWKHEGVEEWSPVLLVDDDTALLGTLGLFIAAEGHLVRTATNGSDALRLALEIRPDILVTDCAMPAMDGIAVVREMQRHVDLASVPVILTSDASRRPHVKLSGFLKKPSPATTLLRQIHRLSYRSSRRNSEAVRKRSYNAFFAAPMPLRARRRQ
ncbi:response regulator [Paraburkholderia sp. RL18-103-BIB-C]